LGKLLHIMSQESKGFPSLSNVEILKGLARWCTGNPFSAALLLAIVITLVYFFGFAYIFISGTRSTAYWAWEAWNPGMNQEHSKLVPLISLFLVWYHRAEIAKAPKHGSNNGLIYVGIGVLLFVLSARCLQPRMALMSLPFLLYGSVLYLWGKNVARIVLFPCAFLIFTIPVAAMEQATFKLQFAITGIVGFLSHLLGINIQAIGTTLTAADGSFNFEIAEGCSGIRSLTAMTMLVSVYVHLTQNRLWKKITIFLSSLVFAIIGNAGRIFTVILVARFYDPQIAGGIYHDYSGYVFFPIAVAAMLAFSKLVNLNIKDLTEPPITPNTGIKGPEDNGSQHTRTLYDY
jgi:exosortase